MDMPGEDEPMVEPLPVLPIDEPFPVLDLPKLDMAVPDIPIDACEGWSVGRAVGANGIGRATEGGNVGAAIGEGVGANVGVDSGARVALDPGLEPMPGLEPLPELLPINLPVPFPVTPLPLEAVRLA